MMHSLLTATILASTLAGLPLLTTPQPSSEPPAAETTKLIPLVNVELRASSTVSVQQKCPDDFPWVHKDLWIGSLPQDVTFAASYWHPLLGGMREISGPLTNWSVTVKPVSISLTCTSDVSQSMKHHFPA